MGNRGAGWRGHSARLEADDSHRKDEEAWDLKTAPTARNVTNEIHGQLESDRMWQAVE